MIILIRWIWEPTSYLTYKTTTNRQTFCIAGIHSFYNNDLGKYIFGQVRYDLKAEADCEVVHYNDILACVTSSNGCVGQEPGLWCLAGQ